jgi:hypothetical protein
VGHCAGSARLDRSPGKTLTHTKSVIANSRVAHSSRVLVSASRRNELRLGATVSAMDLEKWGGKVRLQETD